jgi:hypothetical protein
MRLVFHGAGRTLCLDVGEGVLSLDGLPLAEIDSEGFTVGTLQFASLAVLPDEDNEEPEEVVEVTPPKQRRRRGRKVSLPPSPEPELEVSGEVAIYEREGEDEVVE